MGGNTKSMIIFLTDGQATTGVTGSEEIRSNIEAENTISKVPIYGQAFGSGADFNLMKTLSEGNGIVITGQIDENDIDSVEVIITGEANDGPVVRKLSICPMPKPMPLPLPLPIEVQEGEDQ